MAWKAILLDFNGVIVNDEAIHEELINELLLGENLRPQPSEYRQFCRGKSDRKCLVDILTQRGRVVPQEYVTKLLEKKAEAYRQKIAQLDALPIYAGVREFLETIKQRSLLIGLVTGSLRGEVDLILDIAGIAAYFAVIVAGDDTHASKPEPDGYLLAARLLGERHPHLSIQPADCLVVEDTLIGIEAGKNAGMQVVGVANTYPVHILQRQANWTVDRLSELELDRIERVLSQV